MGEFFIYIIKSSVCLTLFFLFYKLLLSGETFHRFNRVVLLCLLILSAGLPLIVFKTAGPIAWQSSFLDWEAILKSASVVSEETAAPSSHWPQWLLAGYWGGVAFFFFRTVFSFVRMSVLIRSGERKVLANHVTLVYAGQPVTPFSWMRYIVVYRKEKEGDLDTILEHEMAHISCRHSWDLLGAEAWVILQWFNPFAWLWKRELQQIHEYEADKRVLDKGRDARSYQLLLIKKAVGTETFLAIANGFNQSELNKRISMMLKSKSNAWAKWKCLYVLPLSMVVLTVFARPEISRELDKISTIQSLENLALVRETGRTDTSIHSPKKGNHSLKKKEAVQPGTPAMVKEPDQILRARKGKPVDKVPSESNAPVYYVDGFEAKSSVLGDLPKDSIKSVSVLKGESAKSVYGEKGKNGVVLITTHGEKSDNPLIFIDGQRADQKRMRELDPDKIESISVLKNESAVEAYGAEGKNGVLLITSKKR